jgi:hypothetical protein
MIPLVGRFTDSLLFFPTGFLGFRYAPPQALCYHLLRRFVDGFHRDCAHSRYLRILLKKQELVGLLQRLRRRDRNKATCCAFCLLLPSAFRRLPSAVCLPPSAFCLLPSAFRLPPPTFCLSNLHNRRNLRTVNPSLPALAQAHPAAISREKR